MKRYIITIIITITCISCSNLFSQPDFNKFEQYRLRYGNKCLDEKITDNFGEGYDSLYGTRNMRVVLHGAVYRGGANNFYNKHTKRDNKNPLPDEGLENLAGQGFSASYYLYSKNFTDSKKEFVSNKGDTLFYRQNSLDNSDQIKDIIKNVYEVIYGKSKGPIYLHCWNGWHQSGYISAILLRQFCNYSSEQAVKYWIANTDGNYKSYEHIIMKIKSFQPFGNYRIEDSARKEICPCSRL